MHLIVSCYHVTYAFQSESTLYICLNVKELLARNRCDIQHFVYVNLNKPLLRLQTTNESVAEVKLRNTHVALFSLDLRNKFEDLKNNLIIYKKGKVTNNNNNNNNNNCHNSTADLIDDIIYKYLSFLFIIIRDNYIENFSIFNVQ